MTDQEIIVEVAKLDDPQHKWEIYEDIYTGAKPPPHYKKYIGYRYPAHSGWINAKPYLTSRDVIIPVIEKQFNNIDEGYRFMACLHDLREGFVESSIDYGVAWFLFKSTPRQLCIALLKATGKWKD